MSDLKEKLFEAYEVATLQAAGCSEGLRAPIYNNHDGTFSVGGMLDQHTSDIDVTEMGSVGSWDANEWEFGEYGEEMTDEEKAQEVFSQNGRDWFDQWLLNCDIRIGELEKCEHGAGGFQFHIREKGNTKFSDSKTMAIIDAINEDWTEGVYFTTTGRIKKQLLNGDCKYLKKDSDGNYSWKN